MILKIDPCSHNITQLTRQKGIKSLWQSPEQLLSCQGSLIVAAPAVHSAYRYLKVSHRIHSYKGSCYTAWMWYILLNELLLQQSSAVLNGQYQCVAFACLLISIPSLLMNSLMRSKPASQDKSPPSKLILIWLFLSNGKVFTILIKGTFCWYYLRLDTLILPQMDALFSFTW